MHKDTSKAQEPKERYRLRNWSAYKENNTLCFGTKEFLSESRLNPQTLHLDEGELEPQGEIIADYYMMIFDDSEYASDSGLAVSDINLFCRVLKEFLENPGDKKRTPLQFRKKDDDDFTGA